MKYLRHKPDIVAILVRLGGALTILGIPFRTLPVHFFGWLPFDSGRATHIAELLAGLGLLYLASQLHRRKRSALLATSLLLVILTLIESIHVRNHHLGLAALFCLILFVLLSERAQYVVRNDVTSLRRSLLIAGGLLLAVAGFVLLTFARIDQREFGRHHSMTDTLVITAHAVAGQPLPQHLATRRDRDLIFSLQAASVISASLTVLGLFYPIRLRLGSSRASRMRAETILRTYETSSEDYLKLWPADKHYYFYKDSFIAYGVSGGVALVLHGASGDPRLLAGLRVAFMEECRLNGWQVSVLHASETEKQAWASLGLRSVYIGSEARVDIEEFCAHKARDKHFRYIANRAAKDGLTVSELPAILPDETMRQLRAVSDGWIAGGKHEYRFVMGYFDESYLRKCRIFAVTVNGVLVAYINLLPTFQSQHLSIDHMRALPAVSGSTMHFLLLHVMLALRGSGAQTLNLGLSPLSKLEDNVSGPFQPILSIIKNLGSRYYSFAGLEQFKGKFSPGWEPTYLLYDGLPTRLAAVGSAVMATTTYQMRPKLARYARLILALSVISGLCYASFPLAISLNPASAWQAMVSVLGQAGQPYAGLFNTLDTVASVVSIVVILCLLSIFKRLPKLLRWAAYAVIISDIGDLLSAMFKLPAGVTLDAHVDVHVLANNAILAHGAASLLNSLGFIVAVVLWGLWVRASLGRNWRHLFMFLILALCTVGLLLGQLIPDWAPAIQRLFVVSYSVWFTLLCYDILKIRYDTE